MTQKAIKGCIAAFVDYSSPEECDLAILALDQKYKIRTGIGVITVKYAIDARTFSSYSQEDKDWNSWSDGKWDSDRNEGWLVDDQGGSWSSLAKPWREDWDLWCGWKFSSQWDSNLNKVWHFDEKGGRHSSTAKPWRRDSDSWSDWKWNNDWKEGWHVAEKDRNQNSTTKVIDKPRPEANVPQDDYNQAADDGGATVSCIAPQVDEGVMLQHESEQQESNDRSESESEGPCFDVPILTELRRQLEQNDERAALGGKPAQQGPVYCADCQFWLNGLIQWENHKIGKKHRKNQVRLQKRVKKLTQEPDMSKVPGTEIPKEAIVFSDGFACRIWQ